MTPYYQDDHVQLYHGDCRDVLAALPDESVHAVVTDPPYGLEFMGKGWDAPWQESGINTDAGMSATGYADGGDRLPRPTFTSSTNPNCVNCGGKQRGRRDGTAIVAVCTCEDPRFPNTRAVEMRAFQQWCEAWARECLRVLKPGGHMLAFGGSRTWHRLASAVEDAGFEIRDSIAWLYGSGFPKSLNVEKAIERIDQHEALDWRGWGTALKPAFEPIVVARKPLVGTVAANVLAFGTGALNVDGCRVGTDDVLTGSGSPPLKYAGANHRPFHDTAKSRGVNQHPAGRWPANVVLDDSQAAELDRQSGKLTSGANPARRGTDKFRDAYGDFKGQEECTPARGADTGGASRFFPTFRYEAKAPASERPRVDGVAHPTVKPLALMQFLVRLVTPPGGVVLEPFAGSGTTLEAALAEGFACIGVEREADYLPLIMTRITKPVTPPLDFEVPA